MQSAEQGQELANLHKSVIGLNERKTKFFDMLRKKLTESGVFGDATVFNASKQRTKKSFSDYLAEVSQVVEEGNTLLQEMFPDFRPKPVAQGAQRQGIFPIYLQYPTL